MIARLVRSVDFERVLRTRSQRSSAHFALHHLAGTPALPPRAAKAPPFEHLSTDKVSCVGRAVDDKLEKAVCEMWWGAVVPKRHARRSVTRTLLKRQIRAVVNDRAEVMSSGLWVVRLRAPFDRTRFVSASSDALKRAVREELDQLFVGAAIARRPPSPP